MSRNYVKKATTLESVIKKHTIHLEDRRHEYATVRQEQQHYEQLIEKTLQQIDVIRDDIQRYAQHNEQFDMTEYLLQREYLLDLIDELERTEAEKLQVDERLNQVIKHLNQALIEIKSFENLKEKNHRQASLHQEKQLTKQMDELWLLTRRGR
ncbi:MAG: hypothetical protein OEZ58_06290 [Gammaproteobacteria bacterium]|nr:hypothetical protein [Gammaproteobacteria bacterium]MDH5728579.1 hypothetical protein [Gammaproteobacteria bacterium]